MSNEPRIYIEACPLIDLAKFKARRPLGTSPDAIAVRQRDVWYIKRILAAAKDRAVVTFTSFVTIAECLQVRNPDEPRAIPDADTQRFYSELLTSGKAGLVLVYPTQSIMGRVRELWWRHGIFLKPLDAIHVATALDRRCTEIWTRDRDIVAQKDRLAQLKLSVISPSETALLPAAYAQDDFDEQLEE